MWVSLDTDVIQYLSESLLKSPAAFSNSADSLVKGLKQSLRHEPTFIVTQDIAFQMFDASNLIPRIAALEKLKTALMTCNSRQIIERETKYGDAYRWVIDHPLHGIAVLRQAPSDPEWSNMLNQNLASRHYREGLIKQNEDFVRRVTEEWVVSKDPIAFRIFTALYRLTLLKQLLDPGVDSKGLRRKELSPADYNRIWNKGKGIRAMVSVLLATTYRRLIHADRAKFGGSIGDLAFVTESAYGDAIVTRDVDLAESGKLINQHLVPIPKFFHLKDLLPSS